MSTEKTAESTSQTTTSTPPAPKRIKELLFRENFSLDDAEAARLLDQKRWSGKKFDFTGATRRFAETLAEQQNPDAYWDTLTTLPVGHGGGRFGRPQEFSCDLVAQYLSDHELDLVRDKALQLIRREIIGLARMYKPGMLTLPKILQKMHHRVSPDETGNRWLLTWTVEQLATVHKGLLVTYQKTDGELSLLEVFERMAGTNGNADAAKKSGKKAATKRMEFPDEKARAILRGFVEQSMENQNESCLELSSLVAAMFRTRPAEIPAQDIVLKVEFILRHCYEYQVAFNAAVEECKTGQTFRVKEKGDRDAKENEFSFLVLETNNDLVIPAAQTEEGGNHALVLLKSDKDNVIFKLGGWMRGTSLKNLAKMVEVLETKARKKPVNSLDIATLGMPGQLKRADRWTYNDYSKVLSNGFGKSNVPSTPIPLKELVVAALSAFHHEMFFGWMKRHGVRLGSRRRNLTRVGDAIKAAEKNTPPPQDENPPTGEDKKAA